MSRESPQARKSFQRQGLPCWDRNIWENIVECGKLAGILDPKLQEVSFAINIGSKQSPVSFTSPFLLASKLHGARKCLEEVSSDTNPLSP